jgi:DNA-binding PadR family transcriptional regulator
MYYVVECALVVSFGRTRQEGVSKLNGPALLVLTSLASGPKHGHALLKDIESFAGDRLGAGTLYGAVARLEERGLILALPEDDRRRPYEITAAGAALFREVIADMDRIVATGRARLAFLPDLSGAVGADGS